MDFCFVFHVPCATYYGDSQHLHFCSRHLRRVVRENIRVRLNSVRERYIANGGKLACNVGSIKNDEAKKNEYKKVLKELKNGMSVRKAAKRCYISVSTVQRLK